MRTKTLKRILWWVSWGLIINGFILCFVFPFVNKIRADKIAKELTIRYGIVVRYGDPSDFHVPNMTASKNKNIVIGRVDNDCLLMALEGVRSALSKYPPTLVHKYLSAVFVAGALKIHGVQVAGCNGNSLIYVSAIPEDIQLGSQYHAETLHHELGALFLKGPSSLTQIKSNIVIFKFSDFPWVIWQLVNEPDFKYLDNDIDVIRAAGKPRNTKDAPIWHNAGFVSAYGMTDLENDVSTYAELAMEHPEKLKKLAAQYPRIASKTGLFVEFYSSLAPELADYFKSVGLQNMPITYRKIPSIAYYKDTHGHLIRLDK